jgi:4-hydroxy-2-oxoheptanedioate aldolase
MVDSLRAALVPHTRLVGTVLTLPGAAAAELLADPFDFVWIDLEHAALGPRDAQEMILGAQAAGTYALARIPADAHALMTMMLDAGVDGVVVAGVCDPRDAQAVTDRVAHPPEGTRGWGPRRLSLRRRGAGGVPPEPSVWVQIESPEGVARAGEIASLPGIDAVVVGTADLSLSMGVSSDPGSRELLRAIDDVRQASSGLSFGVAGALDGLGGTVLDGASILVHSTDARICAGAVDAAAVWLRSVSGPDREAAQR